MRPVKGNNETAKKTMFVIMLFLVIHPFLDWAQVMSASAKPGSLAGNPPSAVGCPG
ncbi:hypothetical protein QF031_002681 [Pseudarthrobacter defluvii]|nr:hypothetical protein [Pseudarthrobacter defluvii]